MIEAKDFSDREKFPGLTGNLFDVILHRSMEIEKIPSFLFFIALLAITLLGQPVNGWKSLGLLAFFCFDWVSIANLKRSKRSFGPVKPQVLLLALCRSLPLLLWEPHIWIPLQFLGCFLQVYAFWIEPYKIHISHEVLESEKLSPGTSLRLLHIGDLHLERLSIREETLNRLVSDLKPDIILFSGDFLSLSSIRDRNAWDELKMVLNQWEAPLGIFAVTGSPAVDLPENFPTLLEGTPVRLLDDKVVEIKTNTGSLQIIGVNCTHKPHEDLPRLESMLDGIDPGFKILLHHSPDLAPNARDLDIDMQLSGHTHGGQVCFPLIGPIFTGSLYGLTFKSGRYSMNGMTLYITRGLGLEGLSAPRVRFLCPPEIVMWEITGKPG